MVLSPMPRWHFFHVSFCWCRRSNLCFIRFILERNCTFERLAWFCGKIKIYWPDLKKSVWSLQTLLNFITWHYIQQTPSQQQVYSKTWLYISNIVHPSSKLCVFFTAYKELDYSCHLPCLVGPHTSVRYEKAARGSFKTPWGILSHHACITSATTFVVLSF